MKWTKKFLSWQERMYWFFCAFEWLPLTYIPCFNHETRKWAWKRITLREKFDCFYVGIDTAIRGYVYGG